MAPFIHNPICITAKKTLIIQIIKGGKNSTPWHGVITLIKHKMLTGYSKGGQKIKKEWNDMFYNTG